MEIKIYDCNNYNKPVCGHIFDKHKNKRILLSNQ